MSIEGKGKTLGYRGRVRPLSIEGKGKTLVYIGVRVRPLSTRGEGDIIVGDKVQLFSIEGKTLVYGERVRPLLMGDRRARSSIVYTFQNTVNIGNVIFDRHL